MNHRSWKIYLEDSWPRSIDKEVEEIIDARIKEGFNIFAVSDVDECEEITSLDPRMRFVDKDFANLGVKNSYVPWSGQEEALKKYFGVTE